MRTLRFVGRLRTLAAVSLFASVMMYGSDAAADYASAVLADGPIGYWRLNETSGSTAKNLGSLGAAADGEFFGEEIKIGEPGPGLPGFGADNKAIRLTRLNESGAATIFPDEASGVEVAYKNAEDMTLLDNLTAFTLSGWISPTEVEASNRSGLFGQDNSIEFGFIGPNDVHYWAELDDGGDIHTNSAYPYANDEWHHIALTSDGKTGDVFLYFDGDEVELTQNNSMPLEDLGKESFGTSGLPFYIGGGPVFGADRQYAGAIDEVAVYDKYLTQAQIKKHVDAADMPGGVTGDFSKNGSLDLPDLDLLKMKICPRCPPPPPPPFDPVYDLNADSKVDASDQTFWVKNLRKSWIGDANLDGEFNSGDFVQVFTAGKYELDTDASWDQGDWNADGRFDSGDFVAAFTDGGYEKGPVPPAVAGVPEPASGLLLGIGGMMLFAMRRRMK